MSQKSAEYIKLAHKRAAEKKTHVSFPQLKYPSLRDDGISHPLKWLKGKSMDDGAEGLWRVHDEIYDLTEFTYEHPGGADWLELSKGTDITEVFETHHLNPVAAEMLQKFYVRKAKTPRNSMFTFEEDGFYKTLKREVAEELKKIPKRASRKSDMITDGLLGTVLAASALSLWFTNYWIVKISYFIASLCLAWLGIASHNYIHRRVNWRMYLFNLAMWSYRDFKISHVFSHHMFPNTLMDFEISAIEPIVNWLPRKKSFRANLSLVSELALFPFAFILSFLLRFSLNFTEEGFYKNHYKWHDGIGFFLPLWMFIVSGASVYSTVVMWLWINCTASLLFSIIGINAAHHHPKIFKDGDQVKNTTVDWGMHELEAVMDRTDINDSHFKVLTFFGDHALHHLFPTLDHGYLSHLYPVFLKNCQKFEGNFRVTSSFDMFIGQIKMAAKVDPNVLSDTD